MAISFHLSLLPLKKVDDVDHVEEEPEAGVMHSLAIAGSADALALQLAPNMSTGPFPATKLARKVGLHWSTFCGRRSSNPRMAACGSK